MKLKILLLSFLAVFLMVGSAMALTISDLGTEITINDGIGDRVFNGGPLGIAGEDQEISHNSLTGQEWDFEGMFWNGSKLSIVGGFDYLNGETCGKNWSVGDVFLGSIVVQIGDNTFSDTYVVDLSRDLNGNLDNFGTWDLIGGPYTTFGLGQHHVDPGALPYQYDKGSTSIANGSYSVGTVGVEDYFKPYNEDHNILRIFDETGFLANLINSGLDIHLALECGNEVIRGSVPEPSTMLLFGTGLLGLAMIGRKKLFKK